MRSMQLEASISGTVIAAEHTLLSQNFFQQDAFQPVGHHADHPQPFAFEADCGTRSGRQRRRQTAVDDRHGALRAETRLLEKFWLSSVCSAAITVPLMLASVACCAFPPG